MSYEYVRRAYGVNPVIGQRVRHRVTKREGVIRRCGSSGHYVYVRFEDDKHAHACHPTELDYLEQPG